MDSENNQSKGSNYVPPKPNEIADADINNLSVTPPPYMPPLDIAPSTTVQTVVSAKSSNTPVWVWILLTVFVVGVFGAIGWSWYNSMILASVTKNNDQSNYYDSVQQSTPNISQCSETPPANSVCIGDRIWLKQNLNEGVMINSSEPQTNNGVVEKYCYDNDPLKCDTYGGLYQWDEAMQYSTREGDQGICPIGFHVPIETEWNNLISYLNGDLNDFNNLFGGYYNKGASVNASFTGFSKANYYWSSAQYDNKDSTESYARGIEIYASYNNTIDDYNRSSLPKDYALSVRCVKNWM